MLRHCPDYVCISYTLLSRILISHCGKNSALAEAMGKDRKGIASLIIYVTAVGVAFLNPYCAFALYIVVAIMWFIPDPRIERRVVHRHNKEEEE